MADQPHRRVSDDLILRRLDELEENFEEYRDEQKESFAEYREEMYRRTSAMIHKQDVTNGRVTHLEMSSAVAEALAKERRDVAIDLAASRKASKDRWIPIVPNSVTAMIGIVGSYVLAALTHNT